MVQRMLMAQSKRQLTYMFFNAIAIFVVFMAIVILMGLGAFVLNSNMQPNDVLPYFINKALPIFLKGIS